MEEKNSDKEIIEEVKENTEEENVLEPAEETLEDEGQEESIEDKLTREVAEAKDKYLRLYSEFENFRRRTSKERIDLISTANRELMEDLLPVLDDFERALGSVSDLEAFEEGIKLIHSKFNKALTKKGLKQMEVEKGADFDEDFHEAITQIPAEGMEGKVVDVVEPGYLMGEKVIRFAKVVVGAKQ